MITYSPVVHKRIEKIRSTISMRDANTQMAEECAELAQALLKLNRTFPESTNPTPKSYSQVLEDVVEEFSDVLLCAGILRLDLRGVTIEEWLDKKSKRWIKRLESNEKKNGSSDSVSSDTQDSIHPES